MRAFLSFKCSEIKVTKRQSEGGKVISREISNLLVFWIWWRCNYVENHGKHDYENEKEENENLEVVDHSSDHGNNKTEALEDFHIEKGLNKAEDDVENQKEDWFSLFWAYKNLEIAAVVSNHYMKEIQEKIAILNKLKKTNLHNLFTIDVQRVQKCNEYCSDILLPFVIWEQIFFVRNVIVISQFTIFVLHQMPMVKVDIVDVQEKRNKLDQVKDSS